MIYPSEINRLFNKLTFKHLGVEMDLYFLLDDSEDTPLAKVEYRFGKINLKDARVFLRNDLLHKMDMDSIKKILLHEIAHLIIDTSTGEYHGHDRMWTKICLNIGGVL